jgi:hypothetical protein
MAEGPETGNSNCRGQGKLIDARQCLHFFTQEKPLQVHLTG